MGRHADPDPRHFRRSLATAFTRAALALGVVVGLFAALSTIGGDIPEDGPVMLGGPDTPEGGAPPEGHEDVPPRPPDPMPQPHLTSPSTPDPASGSDDPPGTDDTADAPSAEDADDALVAAAPVPQETRVQVLDGVNDAARLAELVEALEALGYQIVATNPASTHYAVTTVLYNEGHEAAAQALQVREPRVAAVRVSPGLSDQVDLHVVLGADWGS